MIEFFCVKPFVSLAVHADGSAWFCCHDWLPTPIGNVLEQDVGTVWNSEIAKEIRRSILDGSFRYCDAGRCPALIQQSLRSVYSIRTKFDHMLTPDGTAPGPPKRLSLTYDPTCNLKCPSCRSKKIVIKGKEHARALAIHRALLDSSLKEAEEMILSGYGDPFASSLYREFLREASPEKYPRLSICLMTNGLLLNANMWASISSAQTLIRSVHVSIDACSPDTYAINRGGNYHQLLENLGFMSSLREAGAISQFEISFVVQANNYHEMPDFIRLGKRLGCDEVLFQRLINWGTFPESEFFLRSIDDTAHPSHKEFLALLRDAIFDDPVVNLSNLVGLRERCIVCHRPR